jgi:Tfp pilus assembly protein PilE
MGGSAGLMARFLALGVIIVLGMAVYVHMVRSDLEAAQAKISTVEQDRDRWQKSANTAMASSKNDAADLSQCRAQMTDLQTQLEAAMKKPAGRR